MEQLSPVQHISRLRLAMRELEFAACHLVELAPEENRQRFRNDLAKAHRGLVEVEKIQQKASKLAKVVGIEPENENAVGAAKESEMQHNVTTTITGQVSDRGLPLNVNRDDKDSLQGTTFSVTGPQEEHPRQDGSTYPVNPKFGLAVFKFDDDAVSQDLDAVAKDLQIGDYVSVKVAVIPKQRGRFTDYQMRVLELENFGKDKPEQFGW